MYDIVKAVVALLNIDKRFEVIGEAESGDHIILLASDICPDVILMDVKLEGKNGVEATREIKHLMPQTKIIELSLYDEEDQQQKMFAFRASAYLNKRCSIEDIKSTIVRIQSGRIMNS